jgi:hypothetical protein
MKKVIVILLALALGLSAEGANAANSNQAPIADAGLSRYAAQDLVILDGTDSYDPDNSGPLFYAWQQIAGPSVMITDSNTASPTISGIIQTDEIQECEFELVVWDGESTSLPDSVKVFIVPDFGDNTFQQENPPFDADKPTIIYFGGGDCTNGLSVDGWSPFTSAWLSRANIIYFPNGYRPDSGGGERTYYKYGDMIIAYLSAAAPDYKLPIQTIGWSTGGQPAIDVGIRLNLSYADTRYAINRVTFFDAIRYCRSNYNESISTYLGSSVDGEQCWADAYVSATSGGGGFVAGPPFQDNVLNVGFPDATGSWYQCHILASGWYANSLTLTEMNNFNHGVVAGAYWSVIGPGKNLQLVSTPDEQIYRFNWYGDASSGYMDFYGEPNHPGMLPEPVTLLSWRDRLDSKAVVLTCRESENAVGYELLLGPDPYRVMDYSTVSDTSTPPREVIADFPFEETWWTVKARDQHGSTIYADPMLIDLENMPWPTIENLTTGQIYGYVQAAIDHAGAGDIIVIGPGTYRENIDLEGENLTITSTDPNDPNVVAATVINGVDQRPVVTLSPNKVADYILAGLTITGKTVGISCSEASLTIRNCTIERNGSNSIEFLNGYEPIIIDCNILGPIKESYDPNLVALWKMDEIEGMIVADSVGEYSGNTSGVPIWRPDRGIKHGALELDGSDDYISVPFVLNPARGAFTVCAWIKGGATGQVIISQIDGFGYGSTWLGIDPADGKLMTSLCFFELVSEKVITDGQWHHVVLAWNGYRRSLYVDGQEVISDASDFNALSATGDLHIGTSKSLDAGTFFSGLIDDIRIYNMALSVEEIADLAQ